MLKIYKYVINYLLFFNFQS